MDPLVLIFLTSGLFLGWSLGSNDAANVFGTAVGSKMIRFGTAAFVCAAFVILGAVIGGAGAAHGLGKLGAVNALAGSFTVALAAALTVYSMTKLGLPVSTTQAVVGAIIGWNLFSGSPTDLHALARIVGTWIACPILGAVFAIILYKITVAVIGFARPHMLSLDYLTRLGLVLAGAFGAYSLGANNIGNVMGVFVPASPFDDRAIGPVTISSVQQLFFVGAVAIAVGVFYSKRVMMTVGNSIFPVTPVSAWVVVIAQSLVLFIFSSRELQQLLVGWGLPEIPLIPVSSSQAVVGAVLGIGLCHGLKSASQIRWSVLVGIGSGWVSTPIIAAVISFFLLFFMQNVFQQQVYEPVRYVLSPAAFEELERRGVDMDAHAALVGRQWDSELDVRRAFGQDAPITFADESEVIQTIMLRPTFIDPGRAEQLDPTRFTSAELGAIRGLAGRSFLYDWELEAAIRARLPADGASPPATSHLNELTRIFKAPLPET
jgi:PiT family inorganic phosphate transporter